MKPGTKPSTGGAGSATGEFVPTHTVPAWGLDLWNVPDPEQQPVAQLPAGTEVRVVERRPDGWARVAARGSPPGWTDGRHLEDIPGAEYADEVMAFATQLKTSLETYQRLLDDLKEKRIDYASFRRQAFDVGLMVGDGVALMLDLPSGRWHMYDGVTLRPMGPGWNPDQGTEPAAGKGG